MLDGTALSLPRCNRLHYMPSLDSCTGSIQHRICCATPWVELSCSGDPACTVLTHSPATLSTPKAKAKNRGRGLRQCLVRKAPERGVMRNPPLSMA